MSSEGSIIPRDLVGRIESFRIVCEKCGRHGRYRVSTLVETIGLDGKLTDWLSSLKSDCPRHRAGDFSDMCGAHSPDMVDLFCRDEKAHS